MLKKIVSILITCTILCGLSACELFGNNKPELTGKMWQGSWYSEEEGYDDESVAFMFFADGTASIIDIEHNMCSDATYTLEDGKINFTLSESNMPVPVDFDGKTITLTDGEDKCVCTPKELPKLNGVEGTWDFNLNVEEGVRLKLSANGDLEYHEYYLNDPNIDKNGNYTLKGNNITLDIGGDHYSGKVDFEKWRITVDGLDFEDKAVFHYDFDK